MSDSRQFIIDQLRRLHVGDAWHGPSLHEALAGVTAGMAVARPVPNAHNIAELVHHVAAWAGEVSARLRGRTPQMPDEGDFPPPVDIISEEEWVALRSRLDDAHHRLVVDIQAFDPARLEERMGTADAPLGTGVSFEGMLHGLVQHDAYHAGQIVLLARALR
jgi:uncharacterized damage-inducible protein DinB